MVNRKAEKLTTALTRLPRVKSVGDITITNKLVEFIPVDHETLGKLEVRRLKTDDATALYNFYFDGLSEESRNFWPPYPLFSPPVSSAKEMAGRITDWGKEKDWTVLKLLKDNQLIGVGLLKRWSTEHPTSGLAVHENFRNSSLGLLMQTIINQQAILLGLKRVRATVALDNTASLRLHDKCGFQKTNRMVPHYGYKDGVQIVDRQDVELILELKY